MTSIPHIRALEAAARPTTEFAFQSSSGRGVLDFTSGESVTLDEPCMIRLDLRCIASPTRVGVRQWRGRPVLTEADMLQMDCPLPREPENRDEDPQSTSPGVPRFQGANMTPEQAKRITEASSEYADVVRRRAECKAEWQLRDGEWSARQTKAIVNFNQAVMDATTLFCWLEEWRLAWNRQKSVPQVKRSEVIRLAIRHGLDFMEKGFK